MFRSSSKIHQIAECLASQEHITQQQQLEKRCNDLSLWYQAARRQFLTTQQECQWLEQVVQAKQQVIDTLLPYYPHPLTAEMCYAIELY